MSESYKNSGVDIVAGEETVNRIKHHAKSTFTKNVLSGIGHFGAFYEIDVKKYTNPVLVSSVDGVGTKLKIAIEMDNHSTIGEDLVNHCVNDIAVCGAEPLYFLDYLAFGKLNPDIAENIIKGFAKACSENNCSLIGGETAEMPGIYSEGDYDMSGTIVGIVEKNNIINGSKINRSNVLIGFPSSGLHTNGYSLARKVLQKKYLLTETINELDNILGNELLTVHKSYLRLITSLKKVVGITGFSHITGGGIVGNTKRIVPKMLSIKVDWEAWKLPQIFQIIQECGEIKDEEMRKVFNLGIGLIAVVDKSSVQEVQAIAASIGESSIVIGEII